MNFPDTIQTVGEVSLEDLISAYGTPFYVYDYSIIEEKCRLLSEAEVRYAVKANSNISVLSFLQSLGIKADCVSEGEIYRAKLAGWRCGVTPEDFPGDIVYTCDIFDRRSLDSVLKNNITVNCGSIDMISQLGEARSKYPHYKNDITLRINPGFGHGHSQKTNTGGSSSKHGIWYQDLELAQSVAARYSLNISGLHVHIGSGCDFEHLKKVCNAIKDFSLQIGDSLKMISAGGGLPVKYKTDDEEFNVSKYLSMWQHTRAEIEKERGHSVSLEIEPGRFLVAESGYLVSEIRAIKEMGDKSYYLLDAGFNDLARPVMYGSYHHVSLLSAQPVSGKKNVVIGGPLCESGDVFTQEEGGYVISREIPEAKVGDFLVFHTAGAYGASMSSNYNSKPYCAEVAVKNGKPLLIRGRQSLEDLVKNEIFS